MLFLNRRRLMVWLIRAYIKKWGKIILLSFLLGLGIFLLLFVNRSFILSKIPIVQIRSIGLIGSYEVSNLPPAVLDKISQGLTFVGDDGVVKPALAKSWQIQDSGKTYIFHLKQNAYFSDGKQFTSKDVNYNFSEVAVEKPNNFTVIFKLKDRYSPFLVTASKKIFKKDFVGVGEYKIATIKLNGGFVQSIELQPVASADRRTLYQFYPTQESLKTAYVLGEVNEVSGLFDTKYKDLNLASFKNANVKKDVNYNRLVTLFYNTKDSDLSDKVLRKALSYSIPNNFDLGERSYSSISPKSWASSTTHNLYQRDTDHAKLLFSQVSNASKSAQVSIVIKTLPAYKVIADQTAATWRELGVNVSVETVDNIPLTYQVFIGDFFLPKDPDQYSLWHSAQSDNITSYKNLRIDKLLEDGRKTVDVAQRKSIYADFEKYLLDDAPAAFLIFPYSYTISRRPS